MFNDKWQKGISDLRRIGLKPEEKTVLFQKISSKIIFQKLERRSFLMNEFYFLKEHILVTFSLLVILGGGLAFASENSLPGNILYPVKVNITEPARDLIKFKTQDNIQWQIEKADRRIKEAEILILEEKFDESKKDEINILFQKYKENYDNLKDKELEKIDNKPKEDSKKEKVVDFNSNIKPSSKEKIKDEDLDKNSDAVNAKSVDLEKVNKFKDKEKIEKGIENRFKKLEEEKEKTFKKAEEKWTKKYRKED